MLIFKDGGCKSVLNWVEFYRFIDIIRPVSVTILWYIYKSVTSTI
jgi:hypothetical protein